MFEVDDAGDTVVGDTSPLMLLIRACPDLKADSKGMLLLRVCGGRCGGSLGAIFVELNATESREAFAIRYMALRGSSGTLNGTASEAWNPDLVEI